MYLTIWSAYLVSGLIDMLWSFDTDNLGEERPLMDEERGRYEVHQRDLADDLSLGSLLDELSSRGGISDEHVTAIRQHGGTERQQRARLLDIMARRSLNHYKLFLDVLHQANE